jgi:RNA polymerase sigma-70 factor (ECF subfamily)
MLGGASDAEDAVQETMLRAWRALDRFEARASVRTWLHQIATNVCLDKLAADRRRGRPYELGGPMSLDAPDMRELPAEEWIEPIADHRVVPPDADPAARALMKESVRLAFVAALQHLPPKQRAALLLTEVLDFSVPEVAESLDTSTQAIHSALQRARETLKTKELDRLHAPLPPPSASLLDAFLGAFERYDVPRLTELLRDDAVQNMPPYVMWLRGAQAITAWMLGPGAGCRGSRLVPIEVSGGPGFAQYRRASETPRGGPPGGHAAWAIVAIDALGDRVGGLSFFLDTARFFPAFGLPLTLERGAPLPLPNTAP